MVGKIGQSEAVQKKHGANHGSGVAQEIARTARTEKGLRTAAAENRANIRTLPLLNQNKPHQDDTNNDLEYQQRRVHRLSLPVLPTRQHDKFG